jgi:hypothetical protein
MLIYFACEAAGAIGARRFLRPLFSGEEGFWHNSGALRRGIAGAYLEKICRLNYIRVGFSPSRSSSIRERYLGD